MLVEKTDFRFLLGLIEERDFNKLMLSASQVERAALSFLQ